MDEPSTDVELTADVPFAPEDAPDALPRVSRLAIIGNGVSALTALSVFQANGFERGDVVVYGDQTDPFANLRRYTRAIQQDRMRSESSGHFFPTDFPGLALLESLRRHTPSPLVSSLFDRYQPRLDDLLTHGDMIARAVKPTREFVRTRISRIAYSPPDRFILYDGAGNVSGAAQNVLLALGHPRLRWPPSLKACRNDARVSHAYQRKSYRAGDSVLVIGAGMAATHEWLAALRAGCRVVALTRHPFKHQPLNAPRCDFSATGLDRYRRMNAEERHAYLDRVASGSYPLRRDWERELARGEHVGSWQSAEAELVAVEPHGEELVARLSNGRAVIVNRIVSATGFIPDAKAHPLIACLVSDYGATVERGRLIINDDFTVREVGGDAAKVAVIGNLARWSLPIADTFVGMKYVARRLGRTFGTASATLNPMRSSLRLMRAET